MGPTRELIDALYRDEIRWSREEDPGEKILDGPRLYDFACEFTRAGIRHDLPGADEGTIERILAERLALGERLKRTM